MTLNSHYKCLNWDDGKCYALRFKGDGDKYYSAYRWEPIMEGNSMIALKVSSRLIGAGSTITIDDITKESYWNSNNGNDVIRYFPAAGYKDGTEISGINSEGWYGCTTLGTSGTMSWTIYFSSWWAMAKNNLPTSWATPIRLFANSSTDPDTPDPENPHNADIAFEVSKPNSYINILVKGPKKVDVDFGDGIKETIDIEKTSGIIEGVVKGKEFYLFSNDIVEIEATKNKLVKFEVHNGENMKSVNIGFNAITELCLKNMPNLEYLSAVKNYIAKVDIESCPKLEYISLASNEDIKELNLTNNPVIKQLHVGKNSLSSLDLSNLPLLEILSFGDNPSIKSIDISKLPLLKEIDCSNSSLNELNIENNPKIVILKASGSKGLSNINYQNLNNLLCLHIYNCNMSQSSIDQIISDLPNVNSIEVRPEERIWKRQFEFDMNPGSKTAKATEAKDKGWYTDILGEAWSIGTANPCLVITTEMEKNEQISFTVENFFDPFWIFWGKFWGSYYQTKTYTLKHDVVAPEINYYSRGLMTFKCNEMMLEKLNLTGNDQTYAIDVRDNNITDIVLDTNNVIVNMNISNNKLSGETLNKIFSSLNKLGEIKNPFYFPFEDLNDYGIIDITGNPGCDACDIYIAEEKGYKVIGAIYDGIEEIENNNVRIQIDLSGNIVASSNIEGIVVHNMDGTIAYKSNIHSDLYRTELKNGIYIIGYKHKNSSTYNYVKATKK